MQLRCKYCKSVQPVNVADEADEDPRTQGIRRTFRAEHITCGEKAVALELHALGATVVDPDLWKHYVAHVQPPTDITIGGDGFFTRTIQRDGKSHNVRVCEDCWQTIPRYVEFPAGLISPESDGTETAVAKMRPTTVDTDSPDRAAAGEHLWKAVCLPCYLAAFTRVYPDVPLPVLNHALIGDGAPVEVPKPPEPEMLGRVTVAKYSRQAGDSA
jgi:hypothetical protein